MNWKPDAINWREYAIRLEGERDALLDQVNAYRKAVFERDEQLNDVLHQLWHAIEDPNFDKTVAQKVYDKYKLYEA
jgi:hypothetical protein